MYQEGNEVKLNELATALAKAQAEFPAVPKTGKNPHLQTSYATLDDIIGAVRKPLAKNGLSFVQLLSTSNGHYEIQTILLHESGQSLQSTVQFLPGEGNRGINALQALGATITYIKRYSLSALLGVAVGEDDDGESGTAPKPKPQPRRQAPKPKPKPKPRTRQAQPRPAGEVAKDVAKSAVHAKPQPPAEPPEDALLIRNPTQLIGGLKWLNYYKNGRHIMGAYNKVTGESIKSWPENSDFYPEAYDLLVNYAQEQQAQEAEEE